MAIHHKLVQDLVDYLQQQPDVGTAFKKAFNAAVDTGVLRKYNISTLEEYLAFYDTFMTWTPKENATGTLVYELMCLSYLVLDFMPQFQTSISPDGRSTWLSKWLIHYAQEIGKFMDTPESIDETTLATFYNSPRYHMQDYPVPPGGWRTFNHFFSRHIDPAVRPIAEPMNPNVIVSPADSAFCGSWGINDNAEVGFKSKGIPWRISQLLEDTAYGERFKGGVFMHAFLAPWDYHRQHAPVAGTVVEAKVVPGLCFLEVAIDNGNLKMIAGRKMPVPPGVNYITREGETEETPGWQFLQARGVVVIDNPDLGLVAVCPIGMAQVSSVNLTVRVGDVLQKGQELSYFTLGGSDIIMVFEKKANVKFPEFIDPPVHYDFGAHIATAYPNPACKN